MTAAVYARKSTEQAGVADEERSVTRQIERAREYALKKGWRISEAHIFVDDGVSGAEFLKRRGLLRLLNSLNPRPPFDVLIMSEESRLGRERIATEYNLKQISDAGVRIFYHLEDREAKLSDASSSFLESFRLYAAQMEREKAQQRTYDALRRKAEAGHVTGGRVYGYDNHEVLSETAVGDGRGRRRHVRRQINSDEAPVVQ